MSEATVWRGQRLPALRGHKVWGLYVYPGGRMEVRPVNPDLIETVEAANARINAGYAAIVALDGAAAMVRTVNTKTGKKLK